MISNKTIDLKTADEINSLFCEVVIAPDYEETAMAQLKEKKNRIILIQKNTPLPTNSYRTCLNGILVQDRDNKTDAVDDLDYVTEIKPSPQEVEDLIFAFKTVKHVKSNGIVFAKNRASVGIGSGNTSRVDSVQFAIYKAKRNNKESNKKNLKGAVMASDAFFPFPDSIKIASQEGVAAIIQPGGSINDDKVIKEANNKNIAMVFTGKRCFSH